MKIVAAQASRSNNQQDFVYWEAFSSLVFISANKQKMPHSSQHLMDQELEILEQGQITAHYHGIYAGAGVFAGILLLAFQSKVPFKKSGAIGMLGKCLSIPLIIRVCIFLYSHKSYILSSTSRSTAIRADNCFHEKIRRNEKAANNWISRAGNQKGVRWNRGFEKEGSMLICILVQKVIYSIQKGVGVSILKAFD